MGEAKPHQCVICRVDVTPRQERKAARHSWRPLCKRCLRGRIRRHRAS